MFKEQVRADYLDQVEKALLARPPVLHRIVRVPETKGIVLGVTVLRRGTRLGVHAREVRGPLAVRGVRRPLEEANGHRAGCRVADDVEAGQAVGELPPLVGVLERFAESQPRISLERGPPSRLDPVPELHGHAAHACVAVTRGVISPKPVAATPVATTARGRRAASSSVASASGTISGSTWCSTC